MRETNGARLAVDSNRAAATRPTCWPQHHQLQCRVFGHQACSHLSNDVAALLLCHAANKGGQAVLLTHSQAVAGLQARLGSSLDAQHLQGRRQDSMCSFVHVQVTPCSPMHH